MLFSIGFLAVKFMFISSDYFINQTSTSPLYWRWIRWSRGLWSHRAWGSCNAHFNRPSVFRILTFLERRRVRDVAAYWNIHSSAGKHWLDILSASPCCCLCLNCCGSSRWVWGIARLILLALSVRRAEDEGNKLAKVQENSTGLKNC